MIVWWSSTPGGLGEGGEGDRTVGVVPSRGTIIDPKRLRRRSEELSFDRTSDAPEEPELKQ